jgi:hypothetical protein
MCFSYDPRPPSSNNRTRNTQPAHRPTNHGTKQPPSAIEWPTSQPCRACVRRGTTAERAGVWKAGWSKEDAEQPNPTGRGDRRIISGRWQMADGGSDLPCQPASGDGTDVCVVKWVMVLVGLGLSQLRVPLDVSSSHLPPSGQSDSLSFCQGTRFSRSPISSH